MIKTSSKIQSRNQIQLMVFMARKSQARQNKHQCLSHKQKLITNWVKMDQIRIISRIKMPKIRSKIKNLKAKLKKWPKLKKRLKLRQTLFPKFKKALKTQKTKTVPPRRKRKKKKNQVMMMRIRLLVPTRTMQTWRNWRKEAIRLRSSMLQKKMPWLLNKRSNNSLNSSKLLKRRL